MVRIIVSQIGDNRPFRRPEPFRMTSLASLSLEAARDHILAAIQPIAGTTQVAIRAALGRILAADVQAPIDVPGADNSAMDGYAVRHADLADAHDTSLKVVGQAFAGHPCAVAVAPGQAVRIMTGGVLPTGCDTVVMQEDCERNGDAVTLRGTHAAGQHVRRRGEDMAVGSIALAAGKRCGPAEIGVLASLGIAEVTVHRPLRVTFFSTGDELAALGAPLAPGQVYDSNRYTLHSVLQQAGCEVLDLGRIADTPETLADTLRHAAHEADLVLTTGGVSVGEADFIGTLVARLGTVSLTMVDMKPGRHVVFGEIAGTPIFGLPGNPAAALVAYHQLVLPALRKRSGLSPLPACMKFPARTAVTLHKRAGRTEFIRAFWQTDDNGDAIVQPAGAQGAGMLSSLARANCYVVLPPECSSVIAGEHVQVQPFDSFL